MRQQLPAYSGHTLPVLRRRCVVAQIVFAAVAVVGCSRDDPGQEARIQVEKYVAGVAARLTAEDTPGDGATAFVDPAKRVAVYLTPEGGVGVSVGFLFAAAGESELACAIAHELVHRQSDTGPAPEADPASPASAASRVWPDNVERSADQAAARLCWEAGYDPRSLAILLSRLADMLKAEHAEEAQLVLQRASALHAYLNGRDWTGELGYRKYQDVVRRLLPGSEANVAEQESEQVIVGPIFQEAAWWVSHSDLYDDGNDATTEFVAGRCEAGDFVPTNEIDAFGHCWYGCEGTRRFGESETWFLGTARERWREIERQLGIDDHDSYTQDVANQGRGRSMADEEGSCLNLCENAAERGLLDFSAPERAYYDCGAEELVDNENADDGSDQPWVGQSWGDPHIVTGDGYAYDFQAAGEFVAIESPVDGLSVQVRQTFWPGGNVSQNTAVAVRIHDDVVGLYVVRNKLLVRVNGEDYPVPKTWKPLPGAGEIGSGYESVQLRWSDGSELRVRIFIDFLNVFFEPARSRSGNIRGLFGNFDGVVNNDLATRDGMIVTLPETGDAEYATVLYERLGSSWQVLPEESMFQYPDGTSPADVRRFERPNGLASADALDVATRDDAAAQCRAAGIRAQPLLDNCIVDVGTTGEARFADAAAEAALATGQRDKTAAIAGSGTYVIDRFVARSGGRYFFQTLDLTGSLDLSRWELVGPAGQVVFGQCLRCNQPGEVTLPASGVYVSRVVVSDQETGRIRTLSHLVPAAEVFGIELPARISAGSPRTGAGRIERAGAEDVYRFSRESGEALRIVLARSDRGLGFGQWSLRAPDGDYVFDAILPLAPSLPLEVTLPRSGEYELRITGGASWPALSDAGYGTYALEIEVVDTSGE